MSHGHEEHHLGTSRAAPKPAMTYQRSPNQSSRNGVTIKRVVLHYTTTRSFSSTVSWFLDQESGVSAHYVIGREGQIVQMVKDEAKAWHAPAANADGIGIEFSAAKGDTLTDAQDKSGKALIRYLADEYHLKESDFTGHRFLPQSTDCPGSLWPSLDALRAWVRSALSESKPAPAPSPAPKEPSKPDESIGRQYIAAPVPLPFARTLRAGNQGEDVYVLQCALIGLGFLGRPKAGEYVGDVFNEHVDYAVAKYQDDVMGETPDGVVGPNTKAAMEKSLRLARGEPPVADGVMTLRRTGKTRSDGLEQLVLEYGQVFKISCVSGARGRQRFLKPEHPDSRPGTLQPIPQGLYTIGSPEWAGGRGNWNVSFGPGLGPVWVAITATFWDDRGSFGFHLDENYWTSPGSAGCVVFTDRKHLERFLALFTDPRLRPRKLNVDWGL